MASAHRSISPHPDGSPQSAVHAVIVNWNQPALTAECIDSLLIQSEAGAEIVLVDNGSTDNSEAILRDQFPEISILETGKNLGYAPAANIGIRSAIKDGAAFVLLMNNDALADEHMVERLLEHNSPRTGILSPVIYTVDHPEQVWSAGGRFRRLLLERTEDSLGTDNNALLERNSVERDFVTGCCMLIPVQVFKTVGLLDERFRLYYDDADFCYRVKKNQLRIQVVHQAKAWHHVAASSAGSDSPNERYWMAKSSVLFFRKHTTPYQFFFVIIYRTASAIKTVIRLLVLGKPESARAYMQGLWDGIRY